MQAWVRAVAREPLPSIEDRREAENIRKIIGDHPERARNPDLLMSAFYGLPGITYIQVGEII